MREIVTQHRAIVSDLVRDLPLAAGYTGRKDWTPQVKRTMHDLCVKYLGGCEKEFSGSHQCEHGHKHSEWLLDAIWYRQGDSEGIVLGLESEFDDNLNEILSDFAKILTTKAPIKILLFDTRKQDEYARGVEDLCRRWAQHTRGDVIYAINFSDGKHQTYFGEAHKDGQITDFNLGQLQELSGSDNYQTTKQQASSHT
jgi:hypothetical protein